MTSCTIHRTSRIDRAKEELAASAESVLEELRARPEKERARLFADLFARLLGESAPTELHTHRQSVLGDAERSRTEGIASISSALWRRLIELEGLDAQRADVLAEVLGALIEAPAVLSYFEFEASAHGLSNAARILAEALDARFPGFVETRARLPITRDVLEGAGLDLSGLQVQFHSTGHLRRLAPRSAGRGAPTLELDSEPGRGRYGQTGKRGGYGFLVSERYEAGHASGTFCSPWHDGEEYQNAKPWLVWVLECASEIAKVS